MRQSGFHGAHGVEGGLHGEFPRGVVLAALLMSKQQQAAKFFTPGGQQGSRLGGELVSICSTHGQESVAQVQVKPLLGSHTADNRQAAHEALLKGPLKGSRVSAPIQQLCSSIVEVGGVL